MTNHTKSNLAKACAIALMAAMLASCGAAPAAQQTTQATQAAEATTAGTQAGASAETATEASQPAAAATTVKTDTDVDLSDTELLGEHKTEIRDWVLNPKEPILDEYPLEGAPKITYWVKILPEVARKVKSMNETRNSWYLTQNTGIEIEWIHPAQGQEQEAFNLLLAGGELPDIIEAPWLQYYPAGPDAAVSAGIIYRLNDVMDAWAPDYKQKLEMFPSIAKKTRTDSGTIWGFPFCRVDVEPTIYSGLMIRNDWLNDGGFDVPETIDEWEAVLRYFKDEKGAIAPYTANQAGVFGEYLPYGTFIGAYGTCLRLYMDGGKIVYGPALPEYKDGLMLLRRWYADGLIDPNVFTNTIQDTDTNLYTDRSGAISGSSGGGMGKWNPVLISQKEDSYLVGAKYPTLEKGQLAEFGHRDADYWPSYPLAVVSGKSKNAEYAVKLLNYMWSDVGVVAENFGIEGESYTRLEDGYPKLLPFIADAADIKAEWGVYARTINQTPTIQMNPVTEQLNQTQRQLDAINLYRQTNQLDHNIPPLIPTLEESREYSRIYTAVDNYVKEFTSQFVTGKVPESDFDNVYMPELERLNVKRMLELQEIALERYNLK